MGRSRRSHSTGIACEIPSINRGRRYDLSNRAGLVGRRLRSVSPAESMVFHTNRVQLERDRRHHIAHVLGHGIRFRRRESVHGLLRGALPSAEGTSGALRTREQKARGVADWTDHGRNRRNAGPRLACLGAIRQRPERRGGVRGRGQAVALELSLPREGRRAGHRRCPLHQR